MANEDGEEERNQELARQLAEIIRLVVEADVPEFYVDQFNWTTNAFSFLLLFHHNKAALGEVEPQVRFRMSPEFAKAFAILLKKAVKWYEETNGVEIALSNTYTKAVGISLPDDWI